MLFLKGLTQYKNELNTLSIGKWTPEEMNFLFAILTQVRDEGCKEMVFDTNTLKTYVNFDRNKPDRWNKTMINVTKKISQLVYFNMENGVFEAMPLFRKFSVDTKTNIVSVKVSEEMSYILNKLNIDTANWTAFDFAEFSNLRSTYSKTVYRHLKQFKKTGWWRVDDEDFRTLLDIPKTYKATHIDSRVLAPIQKELPQYFKGLKIHKIKSKQRGNKVIAYEFTFQKQVTTQWIEGKYDSKKALRKETLPEWAKDGYQHEEPELDEKIQQELANRLKKYEQNKKENG